MKLKTINLLEAHLAAFLLSFLGPVLKHINLPLTTIVFGRAFFAAMCLFLFIYFSKEVIKLKAKKHYVFLMLLGVIQAFQWLTFFKAMEVSTVAIGLISLFTFPTMVAAMEPFVFKEKYKLSSLLSSVIIFFGVVLMVPEFNLENNISQGVMWGLLSALLAAIPFLINRAFIKQYSSLTIGFYKATTSTLVLIPFLFFQVFSASVQDIGLIALMGLAFTAAPYYLLIKSLQTLKGQQSSSILTLEVVYGPILALFFLGEVPPLKVVIGGLLIFIVTLFLTKQAKQEAEVIE